MNPENNNVQELLDEIRQSVVELEKEQTLDLVKRARSTGVDALAILEKGLAAGLRELGDKFERGQVFIPHLMIASETVREGTEMLKDALADEAERADSGPRPRALIGTVEGDIHDLGKNLVSTMLSISGFEVIDVGRDVSADKFVERVRELQPALLCMSALMTTTMLNQRKVIEALKEQQLRTGLKILVGGAPVSGEWAEEIEADGFGEDAVEAVRKAKTLLGIE